jgi:hypothetical protein
MEKFAFPGGEGGWWTGRRRGDFGGRGSRWEGMWTGVFIVLGHK